MAKEYGGTANGGKGTHASAVKQAMAQKDADHVPFPTLHSSALKNTGGAFQGTKGGSGISHNDKDTGFATHGRDA